MPDQPAPSSTQPQLPSQTPPKQLPQKPVVSFNVLFVVGIIFAFLVIIISLLFLRNNWLRIGIAPQESTEYQTETQQQKNTSTSPTIPAAAPTRTIARISGWEVYRGSAVNYSFQYPKNYRVEEGGNGTLLLEKVSLYDSSYSYPLLNVTVWDYPGATIQRQDIENWCFRTLLEEARQENLLCAFMSSAAIDELEIDNTVVYTVNSYSSLGEKVDYYIVPLYGKVIIIQAITLLNEQRFDNGKSQARKIIPTFRFH